MAEERRESEGLGYEPKSSEDGCFQLKNQKMVIPRDPTNFTSAGTLGSIDGQAAVPTEEWVCIEDYYSDKEQSGVIRSSLAQWGQPKPAIKFRSARWHLGRFVWPYPQQIQQQI